MRFALLNDKRIEATKGAKGVCPCCGSELVAKCGEIKVHHWSHKKKCDDWTAEVYVIQDRNGNVKAVDVKNANVGKSFMDSIERAVNKASPLPDDAVFDSEIYMLFSVN